MNAAKTRRRIVQAATAIIVGAAIGGGGLLTAHTAGAGSPPSWVPYADGCVYFTDGQYSYQSACPHSDGFFDFYNPNDGRWVYSYSRGVDANGCTVVWNNAGQNASSCVVSIGGGSGGVGVPAGIPGLYQIPIDTNTYHTNNVLAPTCCRLGKWRLLPVMSRCCLRSPSIQPIRGTCDALDQKGLLSSDNAVTCVVVATSPGGTFSDPSIEVIERIDVSFDDETSVARRRVDSAGPDERCVVLDCA